MNKKKKIMIISLIIGLILSFFIYSNVDLLDLIHYLLLVLSFKLIPYLFVTFLIHMVLVYKWDLILRTMNHKIPIYKLFFYRIIGYSVSYITPSAHIGGEPIRALLLKRHNIEFSKGLSSVVIDKSIEVTFNIFFGIIGFIILIFNYTIPMNSIIIIYSLVIVFVFFSIFYYRMIQGYGFITPIFRKLRFKHKYLLKIKEFETNVSNFFKYHKKELYKLFIISSLWWGLMFLEYTLLLSLLNIPITFVNVFLVIIAVAVAYTVPLPAALGILETFQISVFKIIKLNSAYGVVASIVIRVKDLFWTLPGLSLLSYYEVKINYFKNDKLF